MSLPAVFLAYAIVAFVTTVVVMAFVILGLKFDKASGSFLAVDFAKAAGNSVSLAYPWYPALGVAITLVVGGLLSLRHKTPAVHRPDEPAAPAATS